jgi:hypothetical protein
VLIRFLEDPWGLMETCLARIADRDGKVRAWAAVCPQPNDRIGPLSGIPYGAKDIIDTRGMPTEFGSPIYAGRIATEDALVIRILRITGAVLLGKTHTTAFACFDPAPGNPRVCDTRRRKFFARPRPWRREAVRHRHPVAWFSAAAGINIAACGSSRRST